MGIIHGNYFTAGVLVESSMLCFFVLFVDSLLHLLDMQKSYFLTSTC